MMANEFDIPEIGINVRNDGNIDYADLIVDGKKKLETRNTDSLRPYVGKRVSIVKTGKAYLKAWKVIENEGMVGEASPYEAISMDLVPGVKRGDGAIYGDGGFNRYYVSKDGTIKFDYNLAREEKRKLAQELGFSPG